MKTKMKNLQITIDASTKILQQKYSNRNLELDSYEFCRHIDEYEQWLRVLGYADSTVYNSPAYLRAFLFFLESRKVSRLNKIKYYHVRQFLTLLSLRVSDQTGLLLSPNYQLNYLNALKRFSRYLLDCHSIILDCSAKVIKKKTIERTWLTRNQIKALYFSCNSEPSGVMNKALLSVYYGLGLRRSEGTALDLDDIKISDGVVYVRKGKNSKERYVPMNSSIQKDIEQYRTQVRKMILNRKKQKDVKALFLSERGHRITGNAIYERLQNLARNAGLTTPISLHSLRHSIATHLLNAGMRLENISSFLGHSSLESTQIYTHLIHQKQ
jgi:integrase/recombinase XerD